MQGSTKALLSSLSSQEQEKVPISQLHSLLGTAQLQSQPTLSMLKAIAGLVPEERFDTLLRAVTPAYECSWKVSSAVGKFYSAGNRSYARWGCSATLVGGKLFLFGGRGKDNRTRGSMYILELSPVSFTQVKTVNAPESRDGHTCVYHDGKLVLYGGCEGSEEDKTLFSKVHMLDLDTRVWSEIQAAGLAPQGRDGHIAAQIDDVMVVYGGSTSAGICSDVIGFHIPNSTWQTYLLEGDLPGYRESMGCTVIGSSIYIFGGNISENTATDVYSSDLYRLDVKQQTVESQLLRPLTIQPSARVSCSLSAVTRQTIVMFGGEGAEGMLNDIWIFHIHLGIWSPIKPAKHIESRIAHVGAALSGKLVVFGGLGESGSALNEVAVLTFKLAEDNEGETALLPISESENQPKVCSTCGHFPSLCESNRLNYLVYPHFSYCSSQSFPKRLAECAAEMDPDPTQSLLRLLRPLSQGNISINCGPGLESTDTSPQIGTETVPFSPFQPASDHIYLITLQSDWSFSPKDVAAMVSGAGTDNLLMDLITLSNALLLVSKSEDYLTICLVSSKESEWVRKHIIVVKNGLKVVYPCEDTAEVVFDMIYREFMMSRQDFKSVAPGFRIYFHSKSIFPQLSETLILSQSTQIPLEQLLSGFFYAPSPCSICINNSPVLCQPASSLPISSEKSTSKSLCRYLQVEHSWPYDLRIYSNGVLSYVKLKEEDRAGKHSREAGRLPCDIVRKEGGRGRESWERGMEELDWMMEEEEEEEEDRPRKSNGEIV